jgi:hypothetical protein
VLDMVEGSFNKAGKTQSDKNAQARSGVRSPYFA